MNLGKHIWLLHLLTIVICAYFAARAAGNWAAGLFGGPAAAHAADRLGGVATAAAAAAEPPTQRTIGAIVGRNIFCSTCETAVPAEGTGSGSGEGESNANAAPVRTSLKLHLLATLVSEDKSLSVASILDQTATPSITGVYGIGAKIAGSATVVEIADRWVRLVNNGRQEFLTFGDGEKAAPVVVSTAQVHGEVDPGLEGIAQGIGRVGGNKFTIQRAILGKVLADPNLLARTARLVPSMKDGQPNGFTIYGSPGSLPALLGLFNGDVLTAVNGHSITTPDKALEVLQQLRNASHLSLSFSRKGTQLTHEYDIQ
jgi:general secretion pathway protein C